MRGLATRWLVPVTVALVALAGCTSSADDGPSKTAITAARALLRLDGAVSFVITHEAVFRKDCEIVMSAGRTGCTNAVTRLLPQLADVRDRLERRTRQLTKAAGDDDRWHETLTAAAQDVVSFTELHDRFAIYREQIVAGGTGRGRVMREQFAAALRSDGHAYSGWQIVKVRCEEVLER